MMPPVISLLVAGSVQFATEVRAPEDLVLTVVEAVHAVRGGSFDAAAPAPEAPAAASRDLPESVPVPAARAPRITYDWRSPVFFDVP